MLCKFTFSALFEQFLKKRFVAPTLTQNCYYSECVLFFPDSFVNLSSSFAWWRFHRRSTMIDNVNLAHFMLHKALEC